MTRTDRRRGGGIHTQEAATAGAHHHQSPGCRAQPEPVLRVHVHRAQVHIGQAFAVPPQAVALAIETHQTVAAGQPQITSGIFGDLAHVRIRQPIGRAQLARPRHLHDHAEGLRGPAQAHDQQQDSQLPAQGDSRTLHRLPQRQHSHPCHGRTAPPGCTGHSVNRSHDCESSFRLIERFENTQAMKCVAPAQPTGTRTARAWAMASTSRSPVTGLRRKPSNPAASTCCSAYASERAVTATSGNS
jgi:hypothetical protein